MEKIYYEKLLEELKNGSIKRYTSLEGDTLGEESLNINNFKGRVLEENLTPPVHLVLFGAGHVGKALFHLARLQDIDITVIDSRDEILKQEDFPNAELIKVDYSNMDALKLNVYNPYFCIFTHGHFGDKACLEWCLKQKTEYVGMIGSKGKVKNTFEKLLKEGYTEEQLAKVHAPIGITIGGDTPQEIAVSIMAEIIQTYSSKPNRSVMDIELLKVLSKKEGVLCRIISKKGSAPRQIGTSMFVTKEKVYATVGGGALEKRVIEEALNLKENVMLKEYILNPQGDLNMICGGDEEILFQRIN
ncbi:XdhC and CoxI family protein [Spirochaetales bacterium NM-380-WT-3C1]|uniref:XdhC and CoxI family protein n=1 Tax=Bullifex porci TaxID=2606638 RepID=A0A7X2PAF1_9SPIO|nr:XdhC family protein [Bullifex porci]MSU05247.1 XdhC and CoxI family protein [Bullifex porci]